MKPTLINEEPEIIYDVQVDIYRKPAGSNGPAKLIKKDTGTFASIEGLKKYIKMTYASNGNIKRKQIIGQNKQGNDALIGYSYGYQRRLDRLYTFRADVFITKITKERVLI